MSTTVHDIESHIHTYIVDSFLDTSQGDSLRKDDDLLHILDSLQVLRLIVALESHFAVTIEPGDLTAENLGTVERIAALVGGKLPAAGAQA